MTHSRRGDRRRTRSREPERCRCCRARGASATALATVMMLAMAVTALTSSRRILAGIVATARARRAVPATAVPAPASRGCAWVRTLAIRSRLDETLRVALNPGYGVPRVGKSADPGPTERARGGRAGRFVRKSPRWGRRRAVGHGSGSRRPRSRFFPREDGLDFGRIRFLTQDVAVPVVRLARRRRVTRRRFEPFLLCPF